MQPLDWIVVGIYIALVIGMAAWIGRRQKSEDDYYLAGRRLGAWPLALSMMATQCGTASLIGAPAFVALVDNGGLSWLQYELSVPLATIVIIVLLPVHFRRRSGRRCMSGLALGTNYRPRRRRLPFLHHSRWYRG